MTPIESIKASLELAQDAIDSAQRAIDQALGRGVSGPAYLSSLVKRRDDADADARRILRLLEEKDLAQYRAEQRAELAISAAPSMGVRWPHAEPINIVGGAIMAGRMRDGEGTN